LPKGLILNTSTGIISGTPEVLQNAISYTITASNSGGSTTTVISIKVVDVPPTLLTYVPSTVTYGKRMWFGILPTSINLVPSFTGTVTSWSHTGTFPAGVTLNPTTGVVSGTGWAAPGSTTSYTITAGNSGGSVSTVIVINGP